MSTAQLLLVEIEDTGIGMSEDKMDALFRPFNQAQRMAGGTGLGLFSLAKRIEALQGYFGVERRGDGQQGSVFWFAIPYRSDEVADTFAEPSVRQFTMHSTPRSCDAPVSGSGRSAKEDAMRVLLCDDSPTIQKMTGMMLRRQGFKVDQAENGAEAVEKACCDTAAPKYDVVFMDLQMLVMDGFEATRRIRAKEKSDHEELGIVRHQFIIGLSANSDAETMNDAFIAGIDDFISKPFSLPAFVTAYARRQQQQQV